MSVTTSSIFRDEVFGDRIVTGTEVTLDSSYATGGGESLTAAQLGLGTVKWAIATLKTAGTGSVTQVWYDVANSKIKAYTAAAEAGAVDLSAIVVQVIAYGTR